MKCLPSASSDRLDDLHGDVFVGDLFSDRGVIDSRFAVAVFGHEEAADIKRVAVAGFVSPRREGGCENGSAEPLARLRMVRVPDRSREGKRELG